MRRAVAVAMTMGPTMAIPAAVPPTGADARFMGRTNDEYAWRLSQQSSNEGASTDHRMRLPDAGPATQVARLAQWTHASRALAANDPATLRADSRIRYTAYRGHVASLLDERYREYADPLTSDISFRDVVHASRGHFHRSVAIDEVRRDDSVKPARILPIVTTARPRPAPAPTRNRAGAASIASSNEPIPLQYWLGALNDGKTPGNPLPPDMWGSWTDRDPPRQWIEYRRDRPQTIVSSRIWFFADQPAGSGIGVASPSAWRIRYWDGGWKPVRTTTPYGTATDGPRDVRFAPVTTRCLRAVFTASQGNGTTAGVAVREWEASGASRQPVRTPARPAPACK